MSLNTLSGVISSASLNNNFQDKVATVNSQATAPVTYHQYNVDCLDLAGAPSNGTNISEFTAPDDMELDTIGVSFWNPTAVARTVTMTLEATDGSGTAVGKYLLDQSVTVSASGATVAEFSSTRPSYGASTDTKIWLVKGITYRLVLSSTLTVDRAYGFCLCAVRRRRQ